MLLMDMCCGTGAIGISLLMEKDNFRGIFVDISHKALQVCKHNIRHHRLWHKSKIIKKSLSLMKDRAVDFLVSNPPYLLLEEIRSNKILKQDPFISLYGGKDGLFFYHLLSWYIKKNVKYFACVEIDHNRKEDIYKIFQLGEFLEIKIFKDMNGLDRVLYCVVGQP
jgi:HemK-like putative methylase